MSSRFYERLISYIKKRQLTNSLELLQQLGYSGESALNLLAYLQAEGVEA